MKFYEKIKNAKMVNLFLAAVILFTVMVSAFADSAEVAYAKSNEKKFDVNCDEKVWEYFLSIVPSYKEFIDSASNTFLVSDAFPIYNGQEADALSYMFFIKSGKNTASVTICEKDGNYYSSCKKRKNHGIEENCYLRISRGENYNAVIDIRSSACDGYKKLMYVHEVNVEQEQTRTAQITMIPLSSYGRNISVNGSGICWACSAAMMINHKNGSTISGLTLYTQLISLPNYSTLQIQYGPARGTVFWVKKAYQQHSINITDAASPLTYGQNYYFLGLNKPIQYDFYGTSNGNLVGHSVVLCGSYYDSTRLLYYFADPNEYSVSTGEDNDVTICVNQNISAYSDASLIQFIPTGGGVVYDECTHTYHY